MIRTATHLFARKNLCREHGEGEKGRCDAATHLFGGKIVCRDERRLSESNSRAATHLFTSKNLYREHGEGEKDEPKPHHTAQHDTIIPQNHKTTPHHITSYHTTPHHITTIPQPYPNPTTLPTDKPHTIPQTPYPTPLHNKKLLPQNRRKSFIDLSANRLSQQSFEATRVPTRGQRRRGWRRLTP